MSTVSIKIRNRNPRTGSPLTVTVLRPAPEPCCGCGGAGRLRCGVCHAWYCTAFCQASDWPRHRSNCVHPPALFWPEGVLYQGEEVLVTGEEEEQRQEQDTMMTFKQLGSNEQVHDEGNSSDTIDKLKDSVSVLVDETKETSDERAKASKLKLDQSKCEVKSSKTYGGEETPCSTRTKYSPIPQLQSSGGLVSLPSSLSLASGSPMSSADDSDTRKFKDVAVLPDQVVKQRSLPPGKTGPDLAPQLPALSKPDLNSTVGSPLIEFDDSSDDELITVNDFKMMTIKDIALGDKDISSKQTVYEGKETRAEKIISKNQNKDITVEDEDQDVKNEAIVTDFKDVATVQQVVGKTACKFRIETVPASIVAPNKDRENDDLIRLGQVSQGNELGIDMNRDDVVDDNREMPNPIAELADNTSPVLSNKVKDEEVKCISGEEIKEVPVAPEVQDLVKVSRGSLALGSKMMAVVCHLDTPLVFYICPTTSVEDFTNIFTISQACPPGMVSPVVGNCCLVQDTDDEFWYRGEIIKIVDEVVASLFLLDSGKIINSRVDKLKPLSKDLRSLKGLVSKVNLKGVKPLEEEWSKTDIEKAMHILDVGNDVTTFKVKVVKIDSRGEIFVVMKNMEGKDVASVMAESGIVINEKYNIRGDGGEKAPIMYKSGTMSKGLQAVLMLKMVSPMELYFCAVENFVEMEKCMSMWGEAASKADDVTAAVKGDPVLACDDGTWYRAKVIQMMSNNMVQVELVDVASCSTLHITQLKKPSAEVMKGDVMAVSCCLESWVKEDRVMAKEKWESLASSLVEYYEEMQVHVVGEVQGQLIVSVPELEEKLKIMA